MATFNVSPYNFANSYVAGNTTNFITTLSNLTITGPGFYTPPEPDSPETWLRRRVQEVCDLSKLSVA